MCNKVSRYETYSRDIYRTCWVGYRKSLQKMHITIQPETPYMQESHLHDNTASLEFANDSWEIFLHGRLNLRIWIVLLLPAAPVLLLLAWVATLLVLGTSLILLLAILRLLSILLLLLLLLIRCTVLAVV